MLVGGVKIIKLPIGQSILSKISSKNKDQFFFIIDALGNSCAFINTVMIVLRKGYFINTVMIVLRKGYF